MIQVVVEAQKLRKVYKNPAEDIIALKDISFEIKKGEFVSILGPSGAGKTTLLNLIGCLDGLSSGKLKVLGHELSSAKEKILPNIRRGNIGFIFQDFLLIPSLTALENVALPAYFARLSQNMGRTEKFLDRVGLAKRINHFPQELSGGERQRVAIARALATSPKIILADEPTGNLDTKNAQSIFDIFKELSREEAVTVVVATHNVKLAYQADKIIHLMDGVVEKEEIANYGKNNRSN